MVSLGTFIRIYCFALGFALGWGWSKIEQIRNKR